MQASVEVFLESHDEFLHNKLKGMAEQRGHHYRYTQTDLHHTYLIMLGADYWNAYKHFLLKYIQGRGGLVLIELDRQGDERDKNIKYTYEGGSKFFVEYTTKSLSYQGYFNIKI